MAGQGELYEDAVHLVGCDQLVYEGDHLRFGGVGGQMIGKGADARLFARLDLVAHIYLRGGVFPHQNDRQTDLKAALGAELLRTFADLPAQLCRQRLSVYDSTHR